VFHYQITQYLDELTICLPTFKNTFLKCDGRKFLLQIDGSTDISQKCNLLSYVRFLEKNEAVE
jgi:hypothetical protein